MPLITLTGPPRFENSVGEFMQLAHHPDKGTFSAVLVDESKWIRHSDGSFSIPSGVKHSRPVFEMQFSWLTDAEVDELTTYLEADTVIFYPRTRAASDDPFEVLIAFECRVLEAVRFTKHLKRGRVALRIVLEAVKSVSSLEPVIETLHVTVGGSQIPNNTVGFIGAVDLSTYSINSAFWGSVEAGGGNIRVRDAAGLELPFELGPDFNLEDRVGMVFFRVDLLAFTETVVDIVTVEMNFPALPTPGDTNGSHNVYGASKWHWHLDETLLESGPNGADLTGVNLSSVNVTQGPAGYAQALNNGVTDEWATVDIAADFPASYFLIEAWVRLRTSEPDNITLGICAQNNDVAGGAPLFEIVRTDTNKWRFSVANDADTVTSVTTSIDVTDDIWQHLVGVFYSFDGGSTIKLRLYVNGALGATEGTFSGTRSGAADLFVIGATYSADAIGSAFRGAITQVTLYDGLPSSQNSLGTWIAQRYNQLKTNADLFAVMAVDPVLTIQGFEFEPFSRMFPFPITAPKYHPAIGLVGDEIFLAGGGSSGADVATVYAYNYRTNRWRTDTSLPAARSSPAFGVVDNTLYVIGGINGPTIFNTVYARDPDTGFWTTLGGAPNTFYGNACVVFNGEIWVISGFLGGSLTTATWIYTPGSDSWRSGPALPAGRAYGRATVAFGTIFFVGGIDGTATYQDEAWELVGGTTWVARAVYPTAIARHQVVTFGTVPYVIGGHTDASTRTTAIRRYDRLTDAWQSYATLPEGLSDFMAFMIADFGYIFSGTIAGDVEVDTVRVYSFNNARQYRNNEERRIREVLQQGWSASGASDPYDPPVFPGASRRGMIAAEIDGYHYLIGGRETSTFYDDGFQYDPYLKGYNRIEPFPLPIAQPAFGAYEGKLYVFGGNDSVSWTVESYVYDPLLDTWTPIADIPEAIAGPVAVLHNDLFYVWDGSIGFWSYDPVGDEWAALADPPFTVGQTPGIAVLNNLIYVTGGNAGSAFVLRYNIAGDSWASITAFPINSQGTFLFVHEDTLYAFVSDSDTTDPMLGSFYVYDEGGDSWSTASLPAEDTPVYHAAFVQHGDRVHIYSGQSAWSAEAYTDVHQILSFKQGWI